MKIKIVGRANIINPRTHKIHDDEGLRALDGFFESPVLEVESMDDKRIKDIIEDMETQHPQLDNFEIINVG